MRKLRAILVRIGIAIIVLLSFGSLSVLVVNNYTARQVEKNLQELPLPEQTVLVDSISKAGKLTGNGNGMQYFGAVLIKSELSIEELETYYATYRDNEWECIVDVQEGQSIGVIDHEILQFSEKVGDSGYCIVYSWGSGIELFEELDIRGH